MYNFWTEKNFPLRALERSRLDCGFPNLDCLHISILSKLMQEKIFIVANTETLLKHEFDEVPDDINLIVSGFEWVQNNKERGVCFLLKNR